MIILDTHIWIWWINQDKNYLKPRWKEVIQSTEKVAVSSISLFEICWLVHHGRIEITIPLDDWLSEATVGSGIDIVTISPAIAMTATKLPYHHRDPQDRLIIASAICNHAQLLSADQQFPLYEEITELLIN
ncbi:twitching motility protein PilT [Alkalispirochaeta sphaeroplastigenens]|uniref:Twitching motility protein PilT n=1 Tax=Alkalispirochaeta sphaeroplastigenens TaxID=1187066 RepID=A0A2S4JFW1_9SPIO|nr:type II toxin-antitoxin system VapC family toxin [Alkalispirochaeta sphaeroplastigenens]POQ98379.1 twitching motility protein PilT [Alkalispirochaeta sphaeroplastigenens]